MIMAEKLTFTYSLKILGTLPDPDIPFDTHTLYVLLLPFFLRLLVSETEIRVKEANI